jgi:hypothetical protein
MAATTSRPASSTSHARRGAFQRKDDAVAGIRPIGTTHNNTTSNSTTSNYASADNATSNTSTTNHFTFANSRARIRKISPLGGAPLSKRVLWCSYACDAFSLPLRGQDKEPLKQPSLQPTDAVASPKNAGDLRGISTSARGRSMLQKLELPRSPLVSRCKEAASGCGFKEYEWGRARSRITLPSLWRHLTCAERRHDGRNCHRGVPLLSLF